MSQGAGVHHPARADHDYDGIVERLLEFDRRALSARLSPGVRFFRINGEIEDGREFAVVSDPITVK